MTRTPTIENLILAKKLVTMIIITTRGEKLGRLDNLEIDPKSGEILSIIVEPEQSKLDYEKYQKTKDGKIVIPFIAVEAIKDVILVNTSKIHEI